MEAVREAGARARDARVVAVIEVGSTSIRMAIAQIDPAGELHTLDALQQTVTLGKDTFTRGFIEQETAEACVKVLKSFRRVLEEYRIPDSAVTAVATSAVREANNREAFLDRVFIATGIDVEVLDEAEVTRYTFMGVLPMLSEDPALARANTLVMEVGGGSTETLLFRGGRLRQAHSHRLGALRLRQRLEESRTASSRLRDALQSHVEIAVNDIRRQLGRLRPAHLLALGGDARFAASTLLPGWHAKGTARIEIAAFERLTKRVLDLSVDDAVRQFHLSFADAETLGPALLIYLGMAQACKLRRIHVGCATLRDGVLSEMTRGGSWAEEFEREIITSTLEIGERYDFDRGHADYVAELCGALFAALQEEHRLDSRSKLLLTIAALLHNIGLYISNRSHHKHSMYLIQHSEIFGLGAKDLLLAALVARYHRRALPNPTHEGYNLLSRDDRIRVAKLAAILRIADAIGRGFRQPGKLAAHVEPNRLVLQLDKMGDLALERQGLREKGRMFEQVYGMRYVLEGEPR